MITLYDFELSGSCYKVRLLLNVLDVPYEKVTVDFVNKEHKDAKYTALNPFGEIPIFKDGDLLLRDAQAIMVYVARKYDSSNFWYPNDAESMGRINQWLSTGGNEVMSAAGARLVKILNYPLNLEALQARANSTFKILNDHLANRRFLELDHPTIGDLACFPYTAMAGEGGISLSPYPHILNWIDRMRQIPRFIPMPGVPAMPAAA